MARAADHVALCAVVILYGFKWGMRIEKERKERKNWKKLNIHGKLTKGDVDEYEGENDYSCECIIVSWWIVEEENKRNY